MISMAKFIGLVAGILATLFLLGVLCVKGGAVVFAEVLLAFIAFYGIVLYGFLHYRIVRQDELRDVLAVAADTKSPLADAVWAYVEDRPRGRFRRFCEGDFTNFLILGFYWTWHKQRRFDRRAADLASHLEAGIPLSQALWMTPGVASRETILAARVGESTGDLVGPLKHISQSRIGSTVVEILPRLAYPVFLLFVQIAIVTFLMTFIVPRYEKILTDFRIRLPELSQAMFRIGRPVARYGPYLVSLVVFGAFWLAAMLAASPSLRWQVPGIAAIERRFAQGRLLKMLGMLLSTGKTVPQSLALLTQEDYLGPPVKRKLEEAEGRIAAGEPLAEVLAAKRLMPANMVPLLHSAERARNLPWALEEAGDTLVRRTTRLLQRFSSTLGPIAVALMGVLIALTAMAFFLPLIAIMTELTPK